MQCQVSKRQRDKFPRDSDICFACEKVPTSKPKTIAGTMLGVPTSKAYLSRDQLDLLPNKRLYIVAEQLHSGIQPAKGQDCEQNDEDIAMDEFDHPAQNSESETQSKQLVASLSSIIGELKDDQRIVFVAQTDLEVIELLKQLAANQERSVRSCAQDLQQISHMLAQEVVYTTLMEMKGSKIVDILLMVQNRSKHLSLQQTIGLILASVALGGSCWLGAIKMLKDKDLENREATLQALKPFFKKIFTKDLSEWMIVHWSQIEQVQLDLMHQLSVKSTAVDYQVLTLSLTTSIQDITEFTRFASALVKTAPTCTDLLFSSIKLHKQQQKIPFDEFLELADILQASEYDLAITNMRPFMADLQICQWKELIFAESEAIKIANASSVPTFIHELSAAYGDIEQLADEATVQFKDFNTLLSEAPLKPNDRQLALAQYCIGKLYGEAQRQLWVVPSGQGKSRIAASAAALALMSGAIIKVHLVFESMHLLQRDRSDFEAYWLLLGYDESQVEYHFGCDFKPNPGELIIIDEIDAVMFKDPIKFSDLIEGCLVLGFTATPDNFNPDGAEDRILNLLKFQKYFYMLDQQGEKQPELVFDEVVACDSVVSKAEFIVRQAKTGPVLVFGQDLLSQAINAAGVMPLIITEDADPSLLRNLDQVLDTGLYRILVAHNQSAMRGYDYRSPKCQMTLVVDQSFENLRDAIQGYNRVGRFGDQCKRVRFSDVALFDKHASLKYSGVLIRASLQLQKKPLALKRIQVKKSMTATSKMPQKRMDSVQQQSKRIAGQAQLTGFFKVPERQ